MLRSSMKGISPRRGVARISVMTTGPMEGPLLVVPNVRDLLGGKRTARLLVYRPKETPFAEAGKEAPSE